MHVLVRGLAIHLRRGVPRRKSPRESSYGGKVPLSIWNTRSSRKNLMEVREQEQDSWLWSVRWWTFYCTAWISNCSTFRLGQGPWLTSHVIPPRCSWSVDSWSLFTHAACSLWILVPFLNTYSGDYSWGVWPVGRCMRVIRAEMAVLSLAS